MPLRSAELPDTTRITFTNEVGQVFKDAQIVRIRPDGVVYVIRGPKTIAGFASYRLLDADTLELLDLDPAEAKIADADRKQTEATAAAAREAELAATVLARRAAEMRPTILSSAVIGSAFQGLVRNNASRAVAMTLRAAVFDAVQNPLGTIEVSVPRVESGRNSSFRQLLTAGSSARVTEIIVTDGVAEPITFLAEGGFYSGNKRPESLPVPPIISTNTPTATANRSEQ